MENFPISHFKLSQYPLFIKGLGVTKLGAVRANHKLGLIPDDMAKAIEQACMELIEGRHTEAFPRRYDSRRRRHNDKHER